MVLLEYLTYFDIWVANLNISMLLAAKRLEESPFRFSFSTAFGTGFGGLGCPALRLVSIFFAFLNVLRSSLLPWKSWLTLSEVSLFSSIRPYS